MPLGLQLVIVDRLIACACDEPARLKISGVGLSVSPKSLLPNWGRVGSMVHATDPTASQVHFVLKRSYKLMARRVADVGSVQRARAYGHGFKQLNRQGGLEAYRCESRRSLDSEVLKGHCSTELGRGAPGPVMSLR